MAPKRFTGMRLDEDLIDGLERLKDRDGVTLAESMRRALRAYLEAKGVMPKGADRKRAGTRKRP